MFCYKCGTQIPDDSKFCRNCGVQIDGVASSPVRNTKGEETNRSESAVCGGIVICSNCKQTYNALKNASCPHCSGVNRVMPRQLLLDTRTVICIVLSAVMVLAMLALPMFELNYDTNYKNKTYTISLLGDNYMAGHTIRDGIVAFSRIAFVFMLAAIIAILIFKITKKTRHWLISSSVNLGVLLIYDLYVHTTWMSDASKYDDYATIVGPGNVLCIGCALALVVLSFLDYSKEKTERN